MTDNEKMIQTITGYLPRLNMKQLRTILILIYEYLKTDGDQEEEG